MVHDDLRGNERPLPAEEQTNQIAGIYYADDLITDAMSFVDGAIELPNGPGMGIDVDLAKVEKFKVT